MDAPATGDTPPPLPLGSDRDHSRPDPFRLAAGGRVPATTAAPSVEAIDDLHRQLRDSFDDYTVIRQVEWYDAALEPAYLHDLLDRLSDEVARLATRAAAPPGDGASEAPTAFRFLPGRNARPTSMTSLVERFARLAEVLKRVALAAGEAGDQPLADAAGRLSRQFEETLWFMVVSLQSHESDAAVPTIGPEPASP